MRITSAGNVCPLTLMKTLHPALVLFLIFCFGICNADTWTSLSGETLEGEFIDYNPHTETISIRRTTDGKVFQAPEGLFTHGDRIKALRLKNKDIPEYWYTDYEKAKAENPDSRCLILYRNGANKESFELFWTKLLLREDFMKLLKSRGLVVCIPETIPNEVGLIRYKTSKDEEWQSRRIEDDMPLRPVAIIADFAAQKRVNDTIFRSRINLYQPSADPNPFLAPPENPQFIAFEEIEKPIRRFKRP